MMTNILKFSIHIHNMCPSSLLTYHIYHHFSQGLPLLLGEVHQNITVRILKQLKGDSKMVVLQDGLIIVHDGQLRAGVDEELVGEAGMVHVMNSRGKDCRHDFQWSKDTLKRQELVKNYIMKPNAILLFKVQKKII